jgi:hypothetical protein
LTVDTAISEQGYGILVENAKKQERRGKEREKEKEREREGRLRDRERNP